MELCPNIMLDQSGLVPICAEVIGWMPRHSRAKGIIPPSMCFTHQSWKLTNPPGDDFTWVIHISAAFQLRGVRNPQWLVLMSTNLGIMMHHNLSQAFILKPWTLKFCDWNSHFFNIVQLVNDFQFEECSRQKKHIFCDYPWPIILVS